MVADPMYDGEDGDVYESVRSVDRRDFLKGLGAAASMAFVPSLLAGCETGPDDDAPQLSGSGSAQEGQSEQEQQQITQDQGRAQEYRGEDKDCCGADDRMKWIEDDHPEGLENETVYNIVEEANEQGLKGYVIVGDVDGRTYIGHSLENLDADGIVTSGGEGNSFNYEQLFFDDPETIAEETYDEEAVQNVFEKVLKQEYLPQLASMHLWYSAIPEDRSDREILDGFMGETLNYLDDRGSIGDYDGIGDEIEEEIEADLDVESGVHIDYNGYSEGMTPFSVYTKEDSKEEARKIKTW